MELKLIGLICAVCGFVPIIASACDAKYCLILASTACTTSGILNAAVINSTVYSAEILGAFDGIAGVLLTLTCAIYLQLYRTLLGSLRILWLVTLVTSSCTYVYFKTLVPDLSFIPNDITIIAFASSIVLLVSCMLFARIVNAEYVHDKRAILVEFVFNVGALTLRFEEEIQQLIRVELGWSLWYLACWIAVCITLYILRRPRDPS